MHTANYAVSDSRANAKLSLAHDFAALNRTSVGLFRALAAPAVKVGQTLARWQRRAQERRQLLAMTNRELRDIGLTRLDALMHADKPFWRD